MSELLDAQRVTVYYFNAGQGVVSVVGTVLDENSLGITLDVGAHGRWFLPWTSVQRMVKVS